MLRNIPILFIFAFILGCSSGYTPSERMQKIKASMTNQDAMQALQDAMWNDDLFTGVCGGRGFWHDEGANLTVLQDRLTLLAYKKGKYMRSEGSGFDRREYYEKQYYNFIYPFADIDTIILYQDAALLTGFSKCIHQDPIQPYMVIDLFKDKASNIKFIINKEQLDQVMAAVTLLMPEKSIKVKKLP